MYSVIAYMIHVSTAVSILHSYANSGGYREMSARMLNRILTLFYLIVVTT